MLFVRSHRLSVGLVVAAALLVGGCNDPVKDAKDRLAIVQKGGSSADICKAQRAVADAQLQAKNEADYPLAKLTADLACNRARLDAAYGSSDAAMLADKLEAQAENDPVNVDEVAK